jgi:hypothetical protein
MATVLALSLVGLWWVVVSIFSPPDRQPQQAPNQRAHSMPTPSPTSRPEASSSPPYASSGTPEVEPPARSEEKISWGALGLVEYLDVLTWTWQWRDGIVTVSGVVKNTYTAPLRWAAVLFSDMDPRYPDCDFLNCPPPEEIVQVRGTTLVFAELLQPGMIAEFNVSMPFPRIPRGLPTNSGLPGEIHLTVIGGLGDSVGASAGVYRLAAAIQRGAVETIRRRLGR